MSKLLIDVVESVIEKWPSNGIEHNEWFSDAAKFVELFQNNPQAWLYDCGIKYLNIRIDNRTGHFILTGRDGDAISPDRILKAVYGENNICHGNIDDLKD